MNTDKIIHSTFEVKQIGKPVIDGDYSIAGVKLSEL